MEGILRMRTGKGLDGVAMMATAFLLLFRFRAKPINPPHDLYAKQAIYMLWLRIPARTNTANLFS
jgi:hypothetical protein